ncbi:MAG: hypothetical protein ACE5ET_10125, partial [Gammaproteobacteria bacterium]
MQRRDDRLVLSATDLVRHLGCAHLTQLDRDVAEGRREKPDWKDPRLEMLQQRGLDHEACYIEHLISEGLTVVDLRDADSAAGQTRQAMQNGADAIVQARLENEQWQ